MFFRQFLHGADHRRHKLVPLGTYPLHYQPAINADIASQHTEVAGGFQVVGPLGGGNQQFAGHAAHPGTGCAVLLTLDQHHTVGFLCYPLVSHHAGSAGADDRYIHVTLVHLASSENRKFPSFLQVKL